MMLICKETFPAC